MIQFQITTPECGCLCFQALGIPLMLVLNWAAGKAKSVSRGHLWALMSDQPCLGPLVLHMDLGIPFYLSPWHKLHHRLTPMPREPLFQLYFLMLSSGSLRQTLDLVQPLTKLWVISETTYQSLSLPTCPRPRTMAPISEGMASTGVTCGSWYNPSNCEGSGLVV